jgi:hypothetical protein
MPPSAATDLAWKRLLTGGNMRISAAELQPYNTTSVPLADGSGYLAKMGFYHELHCLHKIKRWLYPQYYYSHATDTEIQEERAFGALHRVDPNGGTMPCGHNSHAI